MKTKRFLTTVSAMLCMLAIIGSGFSYWFFQQSNQVAASQTTTGTKVEQLVAVGSLAAASDFTISFDQTDAGRTTNGHGVSLGTGDQHVGILPVFSGSNPTTKAVYTAPAASDGVDTIAGEITFTFTTTITISKDLAAYITVTGNNGWTATRTEATDENDNVVITLKKDEVREFRWLAEGSNTADVTFSYTDGKEPTNAATYNTFKGIVNAATISVAYNVTVHTVNS